MKTRSSPLTSSLLGLLFFMVAILSSSAFTVAVMPQVTLAAGKHNQIAGNYLLQKYRHPRIRIKVTDLDSGKPIKRYDTLFEVTNFQVTVINYGADCAGQFVVTALGDPNVGAPPSALVQTVAFIIGPSVEDRSASGEPLISSVKPDGFNDWKISASCNGAEPNQRAFAFFEFFVEIPD